MDFSYRSLPWNIRFGAGSVRSLVPYLQQQGLRRALVLCTAGRKPFGTKILQLLDGFGAGLFANAQLHVPEDSVYAAESNARDLRADCVVTVGGGSATGLGKAISVRSGLRHIAIPTTYAGSEMTDVWSMMRDGKKEALSDPSALPDLIIYDPELTLSLPQKVSAASGFNAMAQAIANITVTNPNPLHSTLANEAIQILLSDLPKVVFDPSNLKARENVMYGAMLCGGVVATGSIGLHHRLCHAIGGITGAPHAEIHAVLLPFAVAYNADESPIGTAQLAKLLGAKYAARGLYEFGVSLGVPNGLRKIGVRRADLGPIANLLMSYAGEIPEAVSLERVKRLLLAAFEGGDPEPATAWLS